MKRKYSERMHCYALMDWAKYHPICKDLLFHIENERQCSRAKGLVRKRMGVKAGVSDYFLPYPKNSKHGLWIEMKSRVGVGTNEQRSWLETMNSLGFEAYFAYGVDEAIKIIEEYLK